MKIKDKMAKEKFYGKCRLCLTPDSDLQRSHVIPEFFYKLTYDSKHVLWVFKDIDPTPIDYKQKGIRERLLCSACEVKLRVWEDYAKRVIYDWRGKGIVLQDRTDYPKVDYDKIKLFQMSLIWRMSIASDMAFKHMDVGDRHCEQLRGMLFNKDPGEPYEYGCRVVAVAHSYESFKRLVRPSFGPMEMMEGHRQQMALLGGYFWIFFISNHMERFPYPEFFVDRCRLPVWNVPELTSQVLDPWVMDLKKAHIESERK